jgi:hypothetical protein
MKKILPLILALITFGLNAQVVVKGVAPSSIAGVNYNFEWADPAGGDWSTPDFNLPNTFVQDTLALVVDNSHTGDNPAYAIAHPLANEGCLTTTGEQYTQPSLEGKIAVVWRGSCQFGLKAALAENNGAVGIIIINHSGDPVGMAGGDSGLVLDIPVVMISTLDGQALLSEMDNGPVEIFMGNKQDSESNDIGSTRDIANGPRYGSIPLEMANNDYSFDLGLTVTNFGTDDNVGIVKQNINGPSGEVYSDSLNLGVLKSDSTIDTLYQTVSGIEYENGEYNIEYTLLIDGEEDADPSDNIISTSFNVTDDVLSLARTDESTGKLVVNSYPRNAESYYQTCIHLRDDFPYDNPGINGVHLALEKADSSVGGSYIQVQVWEWNDAFDSIGDAWANVTFDDMELIKNQDYICPDNSLNGEMVYVPFKADNEGLFPVEIDDNQRYLVCLVTEDTDIGFGYDNGISYSSNYSYYNQPITAMYIDEGSGGGNNWYTGWNGNDAPSIGLKLGEYVDYTGIADALSIEGLLYPNPSINKFKLNLSYAEGPAEVTVHDVTGKVVKLFSVNNIQSISTYDISNLNNGQYYVNVKLENGKMKNFSMVVNK